MIADFRRRFWVSLGLTVPILALSPMVQQWLGFSIPFAGDQYVLFALASFIFFYGGWPFLSGTFEELKGKSPGMMTLIGLATTTAWAYSVAIVFGLKGQPFFWELATLIVIMLLGHWVEMRSVMGASKALESLAALMPNTALRRDGDEWKEVEMDALAPGDLVLVKPGAKVPVDGVIREGNSSLNEAMLTGESTPVHRQTGEKVIGGSVNGSGALQVEVAHTGEDAYLQKVIRLVEEAQKGKSSTQKFADVAAKWLTFIALGSGLLTLVIWLLLGKDFVFALERMVTVMVISCPHALGLAIPLVVSISTALAAKNGILIRNRNAFENAGKINVVMFDKTGTLTTGVFGVRAVHSLSKETDEDEWLSLAASLEQNSEHPIADGIVTEASKRGLDLREIDEFQSITGQGVEGKWKGEWLRVVSPVYLKEHDMAIPQATEELEGSTVVFVMRGENLLGFIALADEIRPEAIDTIVTLKQDGVHMVMATGDNEEVAKAVARELELVDVRANQSPADKQAWIKELQADGKRVAMTGDGVNDAPALAQADLGIAIGSGTDVAAETADIVLVNSDPEDVYRLLRFGAATRRKMNQNLIWACAYNVVAIPLATGFIPGLTISPAIGGIFMSLSTILVAANAQLLRNRMG
ncbi:MAG: heavy metal translocating P-type ATPase [Bacteroidia bacterium]|nr:heavy metal translocating P-type ATPase [Bacteroidia bacterium]